MASMTYCNMLAMPFIRLRVNVKDIFIQADLFRAYLVCNNGRAQVIW
jgi:hypothetical protein